MVALVLVAGCTPYVGTPGPYSGTGGSYHIVARGQTLWSISRMYGVDVDDIARANRISDARIEVGQRLLIPAGRDAAAATQRPEHPAAQSPSGPPRKAYSLEEFVWPVSGKVISIFGMRRDGARNKGIDIQASPGTQVIASRSGQVSFTHEGLPGFGKTIIVDHGDGFATVYAYVGEILVQRGENVSQRQMIARVGKTGRTDVPALHFEIRRAQKPQNPFYYLS